MTITEQMTVADIAAAVPSSIRVFQRHGVDFCCGGRKPLGVVCEEQGLSFAHVATAIEAAAAQAAGVERDWTHEPLHALIAHIVAAYHDALRDDLPRLEQMAATVAAAHRDKASNLPAIEDVVAELAADLTAHMRKEELVLFPAIRAIEAGTGRASIPISMPVAAMEQEHDRVGELLAQLRRLTDGFIAPTWGCATVRALYDGLSRLEAEMHVHVHLENNVLFPRALEAAGLARGGWAGSAA